MFGLRKLQALRAAHRHVHLDLEPPQEPTEHLEIQLDIVHDQDARLGGKENPRKVAPLAAKAPVPQGKIAHRFDIQHELRNPDRKGGALSQAAVHRNLAPALFYEFLGQAQAETNSFGGIIHILRSKFIENQAQLVFLDAGSRILDRKRKHHVLVGFQRSHWRKVLVIHQQGNLAHFGKLDRIRKQVVDNLANPVLVAPQA